MEQKKYNCLVVDDEPIARKILLNYIGQMPLLQVAAEQINAISTIDYLRTHAQVDIIFLDINMPNLSGLQLLKILQPRQPVIFTTAYAEHAVESYELDAVDYLLKPFSFERFTRAVYKAVDAIETRSQKDSGASEQKRSVFYIKSDGRNYPVYLDEILYCEAMKNYTMVVLKNHQKLMPLVPLSKFEMQLTAAGGEFVQLHRSFLVSKKHISAVGASSVTIDTFEIPIGVQYKDKFFRAIGIKRE